MKKILLLLSLICLFSCENSGYEFDDNEKQTVYFPFQYPIRIISMGEDLINNSIDRENAFHIGINVGGVWEKNKKNINVEFEVDDALVTENELSRYGQNVRILPKDYYILVPTNNVIIPKGSLIGKIKVVLNDKFYDDTFSIIGNYVIPLKITKCNDVDEILSGTAVDGIDNPNRHIVNNWVTNKYPKDFTLFGVKYFNQYHGAYLRRGKIEVKNSNNKIVQTIVYHNKSVDKDQVVRFYTTKRNQIISDYVGNNFSAKMLLSFNDDKITIQSSQDNLDLNVQGNGEWKENGDSWGINLDGSPVKRNVMYLKYTYKNNGNVSYVNDTIVFRDRQITFLDVRPAVK